tara:strand:+ start:6348 stop:7109 length:762 start_codon:yes stop_codon:yes gene_type:complete
MIDVPVYSREADIKRLKFIMDNISSFPDKEKLRVLDVGCGNGIISLNVGTLGVQVLALDVSEKAISMAKTRNKFKNVCFQVLPAEGLSTIKEKFDVVICSEVLEHLTDPSGLLSELHNMMTNNGMLIVTVPNGLGPRELLVTRPMIFIRDHLNWFLGFVLYVKKIFGYSGTTVQSAADNLDHIQFFTKGGLRRMAKTNNYSITTFRHSNFIDDVFPFSLIARKSPMIQKIDSKIADLLPSVFVGGFFSIWKNK